MARGRRRAPVAPSVVVPDAPSGSEPDDVDDFIEGRHRRIAQEHGLDGDASSDDGADLGIGQQASVMDLSLPDDADASSSDGSELLSDSDADADPGAAGDPDAQWGARRRAWYGGDTHEYEIMSDDERAHALRDEEDEARRLQAKALGALRPADLVGSSDEDEDSGADEAASDGGHEDLRRAARGGADAAAQVAPELPALVADLRECLAEVRAARPGGKGQTGPMPHVAQLRFHVAASYAANIAFYLTLRTDTECGGVDVRAHPVIAEIVRLRALRQRTLAFSRAEQAGSQPERAVRWEADGAEVGGRADVVGRDGGVGEGAGEGKGGEGAARLSKAEKKRKRSKRAAAAADGAEVVDEAPDDDEFVRSVLGNFPGEGDDWDQVDGAEEAEYKRRKLNQIVGKLERERQSRDGRKIASVDMQSIRQEAAPRRLAPQRPEDDEEAEEAAAAADERALKKKAKKEARLARKKDAESPHVYTFRDELRGDDNDTRRRANSDIVANRGLTRYRPRDKKTPRLKRREAYKTALKKRKSTVLDPVQAKPTSYGGEASGINMRARKSSKLSNV